MKTYTMKLHNIIEFKFSKAVRNMQPLLNTLPKKKQKHSINVAKQLHNSKIGKTGVYAGLAHDYLERGGELQKLIKHVNALGLPPKILTIIKSLSVDETEIDSSNVPLAHIQSVLETIPQPNIRNIIILIKLADRLDNLTKRAETDKISNKYYQKSVELVQYLFDNYTGKPEPLERLMRKINEIL